MLIETSKDGECISRSSFDGDIIEAKGCSKGSLQEKMTMTYKVASLIMPSGQASYIAYSPQGKGIGVFAGSSLDWQL